MIIQLPKSDVKKWPYWPLPTDLPEGQLTDGLDLDANGHVSPAVTIWNENLNTAENITHE
jgi:hypothetical protein